jgi:outer membrane protein assembly factor BamB
MIRFVALAALCLLVMPGSVSRCQDWPTYMHDNFRSGVTEARLGLPLREAWSFQPRCAPAPAWPAPAKQDFYHDHYELRALETYDYAFHVIAAGDAVYFGSSSQDKIYALDAKRGAIRWTFLAEGPIRFAPVFAEGRLYAGSDDGYVYCLSAGEGSLVWKCHVAPDERMIPGNGRMISLWPVRTGLVVADGVVHGTAGLFPEQGTYLVALDARTGSVKYRHRTEVSPQGYILASPQRLYVPTGRTSPVVFSRDTGNVEGPLPSAGGAYAVLADDVLVAGPGRGPKELQASDVQTKDTVATFGGLRMLVCGSVAYMQSEQQLAAFDRRRYLELSRQHTQLQRRRDDLRKSLSKMPKGQPAAEQIQRQIDELNTQMSRLDVQMKACYLWSVACRCPYSMILAGGTLLVGGENEVAAIDSEKGDVVWTGRVEGNAFGLAIAGQSLYVSTDTGLVQCFRPSGPAEPKRIVEETRRNPYPPDDYTKRYEEAADYIARRIPSPRGYGLVLDCGEGRLACELARRTQLKIIGIVGDPNRAARARRLVDEAGFSGQVTIHTLAGSRLPYTSYFANVVTSDGMLRGAPAPECRDETLRVLRPCGGLLALAVPAEAQERMQRWGEGLGSQWQVSREERLTWGCYRRGSLEGAGEWTHAYAEPGNSACSGDRIVKGPLTPQWFGEPGPRDLIDRHHRNVAPLYKDGRLFVPGDCLVFAVDAYNGTIQWRVEVPNSRRLGAFLDSGSMAVEEQRLYVAVHDQCRTYDVRDGRPDTVFSLPQLIDGAPHHWGYVAYQDSLLFGSGTKPEASYQQTSRAADEALWYRNMKLVTSDYLFAKDKCDDSLRWTYRGGVILNTTIVMGAGRVYFVETDALAALADQTGRMPVKTLFARGDQYLVALDQQTGRTVFKKKIDVSHFEEPVYLNFAQGVLLLSGSRLIDKSLWYFYDTFEAESGADLWHARHNSELAIDGGHGEYNRCPTIVGAVAYAWPYAYELRTGRRIEGWKFDRRGHGCGGVSADAQCLFWRGGNPWMYDLGPGGGPMRLNSVSRPGCWINMIPAGGLLLIPEASSGCTCGFSLQTSLAYIPESNSMSPEAGLVRHTPSPHVE